MITTIDKIILHLRDKQKMNNEALNNDSDSARRKASLSRDILWIFIFRYCQDEFINSSIGDTHVLL